MSIIGNEDILAFKFEKAEFIEGYLYGHFALIIGNIIVGNYNEVSTLTICNSYLNEFLSKKELRVFKDSEKMSKVSLFQEIYEIFFKSWSKENSKMLSDYRDIFWLDEVGEYSFRDKIGIILIDEPAVNRQRIIWKEIKNENINEMIIPMDYFDEIAREYLNYF